MPAPRNQPSPESIEVASTGGPFRVADHRGHALVLFFYPKDNTPGCTTENAAFRDLYPKFRKAGAAVVGVSRDSMKSHENFRAKFDLPFDLASDDGEALCKAFRVIKKKNLYGREVMGIERSTFVFDADGNLAKEWRGVKVLGHADEVLAFVKTL